MASIDFPATIPPSQHLLDSLEPGFVDNHLKDDNAGLLYTRRVLSITQETFTYQQRLTDTQRTALRTFYKTTTEGGTLSFNWTDPFDSVTYVCKFIEFPQIVPSYVGGSDPKRWVATISLQEVGA